METSEKFRRWVESPLHVDDHQCAMRLHVHWTRIRARGVGPERPLSVGRAGSADLPVPLLIQKLAEVLLCGAPFAMTQVRHCAPDLFFYRRTERPESRAQALSHLDLLAQFSECGFRQQPP